VAHARMYDESDESIRRLREICLGFPEVIEKEAWGECTFRVSGGKMFAMTDNNHHESGHVAVWVMAPPTIQESLIRSRPRRFFKPPYVGGKGWVGVRLDESLDWDLLAAILKDGYLMSAPAKISSSKTPVAPKTAGGQQRGRNTQPGTELRKSRTAASRSR
jgi:hypothetical protein